MVSLHEEEEEEPRKIKGIERCRGPTLVRTPKGTSYW